MTFESVVKKKKTTHTKVLGTAALSNGRATLPLKSKQVVNQVIEIVYGGDGNEIGSTLTPPKITQAAIKSLARPLLAFRRASRSTLTAVILEKGIQTPTNSSVVGTRDSRD